MLRPSFREWQFHEILESIWKAERGLIQDEDPRNNMSLLARPPNHICELIYDIQQEIATVAGPCLWLTPQDHLHITTTELINAKARTEVDEVMETFQQELPLEEVVNYTLTHSPRLVRPFVSYDATAIALSFLSGCQLGARYNVPSAHVTIARYAMPLGVDQSKLFDVLYDSLAGLLQRIEDINQELMSGDWQRF
ncbi:hypothetical protein N7486_002143 [Penicillium sp. IBT 16267x]|nr:hypothetical protein N7486_002143 [Penicillium sp. IBT 16267x]